MKKAIPLISLFLLFFLGFIYSQDLKTIPLPEPQTDTGKTIMQSLKLRQSSRNFDTAPLPLQELSNILWAADGINRPESGKRTSPSAHNWQEIDIYVVMKEGAFIYNAKENSLIQITPEDIRALCGVQGFVATAPLNLVYVSDFSRIKSNDDDNTKLMWTSAAAGFCIQNVYLYCASQNLAAVVRGMIDKPKLAAALKLKNDQKIILSQTVGYPSK